MALILSFAFVYFYSAWLAKKYSVPDQDKPAGQESSKEIQIVPTGKNFDVIISPDDYLQVAHNNLFKFKVTRTGGLLTGIELLKHKTSAEDSSPFRLVSDENQSFMLGLEVNGEFDNTSYSIKNTNLEQGVTSISLVNSNSTIEKIISFEENSYLIRAKIRSSQPFTIIFKGFNGERASRYNLKNVVLATEANKIKRQPFGSEPTRVKGLFGLGFESLYFSVFAQSPVRLKEGYVNTGSENEPMFSLTPYPEKKELELSIFVGPKESKSLEPLGEPFKKLLDLGFFAILAEPILKILIWLGSIFGNYGVAIVVLTVIIRLIFYPLSAIAYSAMEKMKALQPEIEKLRNQYQNDQQTLHRELILLYQKRGVNPFSGCLPILVQIPIFFGLYSALLHAVELRLSPFFGWIKDLSQPDYIFLGPIPIPVLTLIFGASFIYQQKLNPPQLTDPAQEAVFKWLPYIFLALFIIFPMPSGLILYWLVNNISSISQQLLTKKFFIKNRFILNLLLNLTLVALSIFLAYLS